MSALRQLLDRYEDSAEADAQGLLGELVVALAREYLAGPRDPQDARDELWDTLNELSERVETLTRDHNGLVRSTARAIEETPTRGEFVQLREETARHEHLRVVREALAQAPTHADLRQLASAVGSLATRVAELESASRDREDVTLRAALKVAARVAEAERNAQDAEEALITRTQERDAALAEYEVCRVAILRVRRGDLVRCTTCEGYAAIHGVPCPDCTDDAGAPRHGVAGLVLAKGGAS